MLGSHGKKIMSLRLLLWSVLSATLKAYSTRLNSKSSFHMGLFDFFRPNVQLLKPTEKMMTTTTAREQLFPEQYPAVKNRFASPVTGDGVEAKSIRPLLAGTQLETRQLKLVYKASRDGWSPRAFHSAVNNLGASVIIAQTDDGLVVGGYNPKGWAGLGENRPSVAAFLFVREAKAKPADAVKLRKIGGGGFAVGNDNEQSGIFFGPDSLVIPLDSRKSARSKLGAYYETLPDEGRSLFAFGGRKGGEVVLKDVIALTGIYAKGEDIPYSGAVFDMTSG
jgi:hypothetical protein